MKLSEMLHAAAWAQPNERGTAKLTKSIVSSTGEKLPKGATVTIMYKDGELYHAEYNDFAALLKSSDFKFCQGLTTPTEQTKQNYRQQKEMKMSQTHDLKLYAIIRDDLDMTSGKLAAQSGHAYTNALLTAIKQTPDVALQYEDAGRIGTKICLKAKSLLDIEKSVFSGSRRKDEQCKDRRCGV